MRNRKTLLGPLWASLLFALLSAGCAHYPVNARLEEPGGGGYRLGKATQAGRSDRLLLFLTFSGGGTRAAALAYGVLEELSRTEVSLEGRKRYLLDEVDAISAVSGGSFTAAYYGLFGNRIFFDFESAFLKRNLQQELLFEAMDLGNWFRLLSGKFGRSDLAAEYYDRQIFEGGTFGDILARGGPLVLINATDLALGTFFTFSQEIFDLLCSDLSRFPVSRAVAASSAVPGVLTPVTLYNYGGTCGSPSPEWIGKALEGPSPSRRLHQRALQLNSYLDTERRPYLHLVDGGISDNLGLRGAVDRLVPGGKIWPSLLRMGWQNTRKVVFLLVNAEKEVDLGSDQVERTLFSPSVLKSAFRIPMARYNFETVELLRENFQNWGEEIREGRCPARTPAGTAPPGPLAPGPCGETDFYLIEVDIAALPDPAERSDLKNLPTSFNLAPEAVDRLRAAAREILRRSPEFRRLLSDLR